MNATSELCYLHFLISAVNYKIESYNVGEAKGFFKRLKVIALFDSMFQFPALDCFTPQHRDREAKS